MGREEYQLGWYRTGTALVQGKNSHRDFCSPPMRRAWAWGPAGARPRTRGGALPFCRVRVNARCIVWPNRHRTIWGALRTGENRDGETERV